MKRSNKLLLLPMFVSYVILLFGTHYTTNTYAFEPNEFELKIKTISHGNDIEGVIPVFAVVTYEGAGIDILTAQSFSTNMGAQLVPAGCSALTLESSAFRNKGDGVYHLGLKPITTLCAGNYYLPIKVDMRSGFGINASGIAILEIFRFSFNLN